MSKDSGVMNIKKKVATLKQELDEANDRANLAEANLREKDILVDKVSLLIRLHTQPTHWCFFFLDSQIIGYWYRYWSVPM